MKFLPISKKHKVFILLFLLDLSLYLLLPKIKTYFQPVALIVPHHNLVAAQRYDYLKTVRDCRPVTNKIILLGPAHFAFDQRSIYFSNSNWSTSQGKLDFWQSNYSSVLSFANLENQLVKNDHAVHNLIPDIVRLWPHAEILPILIGDQVKINHLSHMLDILNPLCHSDCLVIASVDFSHYLPASLALAHDYHTYKLLSALDSENIFKAEVDSPQSLYFMLKFALSRQSTFQLGSYTNSGFLSRIPDAETTTHFYASFSKSHSLGFRVQPETAVYANHPYFFQSEPTLGKRFFYGVDHIDLSNIPPGLKSLGEDQLFSVVNLPKFTILAVYPYSVNGNQIILDRGESRQSKLDSIASKILSLPKAELINPAFGLFKIPKL